MSKYHVSEDGVPRKCDAASGNCPVQGPDGEKAPHGDFENQKDAIKFAEQVTASAYGGSFGTTNKRLNTSSYKYAQQDGSNPGTCQTCGSKLNNGNCDKCSPKARCVLCKDDSQPLDSDGYCSRCEVVKDMPEEIDPELAFMNRERELENAEVKLASSEDLFEQKIAEGKSKAYSSAKRNYEIVKSQIAAKNGRPDMFSNDEKMLAEYRAKMDYIERTSTSKYIEDVKSTRDSLYEVHSNVEKLNKENNALQPGGARDQEVEKAEEVRIQLNKEKEKLEEIQMDYRAFGFNASDDEKLVPFSW